MTQIDPRFLNMARSESASWANSPYEGASIDYLTDSAYADVDDATDEVNYNASAGDSSGMSTAEKIAAGVEIAGGVATLATAFAGLYTAIKGGGDANNAAAAANKPAVPAAQSLKEATDNYDGSKGSAKSLGAQITNAIAERDGLVRANDALATQMSQCLDLMTEGGAKGHLEQLQEEKRKNDELLTQAKGDIENYSKVHETIVSDLQSVDLKKADAEGNVTICGDKKLSVDALTDEERSNLADLGVSIQAGENEKQAILDALHTSYSEEPGLKSKKEGAQQALEGAQNALGTLEAGLPGMKSAESAAKDAYKNVKNNKKATQSEISTANARYEKAKADRKDHEEKIKNAKNDIKSKYKPDAKTAADAYDKNQQTIRALEEKVKINGETLASLNDKKTTAEKNVAGLQQKSDDLGGQIEAWQGAVSQLEGQGNNLAIQAKDAVDNKNQAVATAGQGDENNQQIAQTETLGSAVLDQLKEQYGQLKTQFDTNSGEISKLNGLIDGAREKLGSFDPDHSEAVDGKPKDYNWEPGSTLRPANNQQASQDPGSNPNDYSMQSLQAEQDIWTSANQSRAGAPGDGGQANAQKTGYAAFNAAGGNNVTEMAPVVQYLNSKDISFADANEDQIREALAHVRNPQS